MHRLAVNALLLFLLSGLYATNSLAANVSPQVAIVRALYERFSAEAVLDSPSPAAELADQPMSVLSRYFDADLVTLWRQDRACVVRTHEICRLDFLPLWDSQDASGATVAIQPESKPDSVQAIVTYPSNEKHVLRYKLMRTPSGWRIHDIDFSGERESLRQILGASKK